MNNKGKILSIKNIKKSYMNQNKKLLVLNEISLDINPGEIVSIVGPSGCGKSTLLNIIAGFENIDSGEILYKGKAIDGSSSERGVVFQSACLFPWLNVRDNIAYGLKIKKVNKDFIKKQVEQYIKYIGLDGFENFYPNELSGGMQQRVALARVLIMEPKLLLMDEPFAVLDFQTRLEMQSLVLRLWDKFKPTILIVTHDIEEAVLLSDRILVMSKTTGQISYEFTVPFKRPRCLTLIQDLEFHQLKSEVLSLFIG